MKSHAYLMLWSRALLWLAAFLAVGSLKAELSRTLTGTGGTSMTYTLDLGADTLTLSGESHDFNAARYLLGVTGDPTPPNLAGFATFSAFGPVSAMGATLVWIGISKQGNQVGDIYALEADAPPPDPSYGVTFPIPANGTTRAITYMVLQGGVSVASYVQPSGGSAAELYVGGLESPTPQPVLVQVTGGFVSDVGGLIGLVPEGSSYGPATTYIPVNNGVPPTLEPTQGSGATATAGSSTAPTPISLPNPTAPTVAPTAPTPTATPTAPTPGTPLTAPTPRAPPNTTPSGTSGVTKEDLENQTNQQAAIADKTDDVIAEAGNAIVDAVNKAAESGHDGASSIVDAINATAGAAHAAGAAQITALNKLQGSVDGLGAGIDAVRLATSATAVSTAGILAAITAQGPTAEEAEDAATAAGSSAATERADAVAEINSLTPAAPDGLGYTPSVTGGSGSFLAIEMPSAFGGATVNFNPFANELMAAIASWFRAATEWAILILFGAFIFERVHRGTFEIGAARQATGNAVAAGTGGQATAAVNAGLITAAAVVALTALLSWTFGGINVPDLLTNMGTNPLALGGGLPANVYWFIDQLFPIPTAITVFVARMAFPVYSSGVFATYVTLCRWFIA